MESQRSTTKLIGCSFEHRVSVVIVICNETKPCPTNCCRQTLEESQHGYRGQEAIQVCMFPKVLSYSWVFDITETPCSFCRSGVSSVANK